MQVPALQTELVPAAANNEDSHSNAKKCTKNLCTLIFKKRKQKLSIIFLFYRHWQSRRQTWMARSFGPPNCSSHTYAGEFSCVKCFPNYCYRMSDAIWIEVCFAGSTQYASTGCLEQWSPGGLIRVLLYLEEYTRYILVLQFWQIKMQTERDVYLVCFAVTKFFGIA